MDGRHIDERVLDAAATLLFGKNGADMLRKTYNAMHDVATMLAEAAWHEGYDASTGDAQLRKDFTEAARVKTEEDMADEAQMTMDALWSAAQIEGDYVTIPAPVVDAMRAREATFNE